MTFIYQLFRMVFTPLLKLYFDPTIIGKEKIARSGPLLLVGNHVHALDPILVDMSTKRTVHALAKKELFDGPFGWFFRSIGAIEVDLDAKKNPEALNKAIDILEKGGVVNVSPEAARNYTDEILLPFKKGAAVMSIRTGTTIIPYCIVGHYRFRSKDLKILFDDPLNFEDDDVEKANGILFETIKTLLLENR